MKPLFATIMLLWIVLSIFPQNKQEKQVVNFYEFAGDSSGLKKRYYENGMKKVYFLDSRMVFINNPVIVEIESGYKFIMPDSIYAQYNGGDTSYFLDNDNSYLFMDFPFIYADSYEVYKYMMNTSVQSGKAEIPLKKGVSSAYKINEPEAYLLMLIRGDAFNYFLYYGVFDGARKQPFHFPNEKAYYKALCLL